MANTGMEIFIKVLKN